LQGRRVDAQRLGDRREEFRRGDRSVLDLHAIGAGLADDLTALDAAAGQDRTPATGPVVATTAGPILRKLRGPAELGGTDDSISIIRTTIRHSPTRSFSILQFGHG
jgi:hypothetical protein